MQHAGASAVSLAPAGSGCSLPDLLFCSLWTLGEPSVAFPAFSAGHLLPVQRRAALCTVPVLPEPAGSASWPGRGLERCGVCWLCCGPCCGPRWLLCRWSLKAYGELRLGDSGGMRGSDLAYPWARARAVPGLSAGRALCSGGGRSPWPVGSRCAGWRAGRGVISPV